MVKKNWKLIGLVLLISLIACPLTYADKEKAGEASKIEKQMWDSAKKLDFERAASLRDQLKKLKMSSGAKQIEKEMWEAAKKLDFERAAALRNQLKKLKGQKNPGSDDNQNKKKTGKNNDDDEGKGGAELKVTKNDVPAAALATLKELADGAEITEFAKEIENGQTFYEGSWKTSSGTAVDVLVTKSGDLVETEKSIGTDQVPVAVLKTAKKAAGKDAKLILEQKTMILYEIKFSKDNSQHELLLTPDGRRVEKDEDDDEHDMKAKSNNDDEDEDEDE